MTDTRRLEEIQERLDNIPQTATGRANWEAWYGFNAPEDIAWLLNQLRDAQQTIASLRAELRKQKDEAEAALAALREREPEQP